MWISHCTFVCVYSPFCFASLKNFIQVLMVEFITWLVTNLCVYNPSVCSMTGCPFGKECSFLHAVPGDNNRNAKVSFPVEESFARTISGGNGRNSRAISCISRASISIKDHESDSTLKIVEIQGTPKSLDITLELIEQLTQGKNIQCLEICPGRKYKTRLCFFNNHGCCTQGATCQYAHDASELRDTRRLFDF